jgi:flagellar hook-basal body complex protein FliE
MSIEGVKLGLGSIKAIPQQIELGKTQPQTGGDKKSFKEVFTDAVKDVNSLQTQADKQIEGLVLGREGVTTHDAMIALQKADIAFQLMNQVRSRIIRAYEEVMRTQV